MADWPDLKEVRTLLRANPDAVEDSVIDTARLAAIDACSRRTGDRWPPSGAPDLPDAVHQAALLYSARLYRRRDSLDGTVGWGDLGVVRIGRWDPDIEAMLAPYLPVVFG